MAPVSCRRSASTRSASRSALRRGAPGVFPRVSSGTVEASVGPLAFAINVVVIVFSFPIWPHQWRAQPTGWLSPPASPGAGSVSTSPPVHLSRAAHVLVETPPHGVEEGIDPEGLAEER